MGGAALVLALAHCVMAARLRCRLRVLVPAVENAVAGNAFRPLDVLQTRAGITVEVRGSGEGGRGGGRGGEGERERGGRDGEGVHTA